MAHITTTFRDQVLAIVQSIPAGETRTYQQVAQAAGSRKAARAVGSILHAVWQTDRGKTVPCHRVIRSDGSLGGYAGGTEDKRRRLAAEAKHNANIKIDSRPKKLEVKKK